MDDQILKRSSAKAPFANFNLHGFRGVSRTLIIILIFLLMSLPLFTTFNEILTKLVENTGAYSYLAEYIVPFETKAVSVILKPFGIKSDPTITHLYIENRDLGMTAVYFSWNCLGWQSVVLLVLTLIVGLNGPHKITDKVETVILGISGTFLINLLRITIVVIIAYYFGQLPATLVHDYGGTLFTISWFFFYWWFAYSYILENKEDIVQVMDSKV